MIKNSTPRKPRAPRSTETAPESAQPIPETASETKQQRGSTKLSPLAIGLIVVVLATALILGLKGLLTPSAPKQVQSQTTTATPQTQMATPEEVRALVAKVAAHLPVKQDESPTIATIQNADALRVQNPTFYKDAQIGDKLLIWSDKAILYSPTSDTVYAVMPISLPANMNGQPTATSSTVPISSIQVEVRNGSGVTGLGKTAETKIKAAGFGVLPATAAKSKTPYPSSFIVTDGTVPNAAIVQLQQLTNASVTALPAVEGPMKSHVLVIVGADAK